MKFKTTLEPKQTEINVSYSDKLFFIGSCFSENIGKKLANLKFQTSINPFGIIYNPISIFEVLDSIVSHKKYSSENIFKHNDIWKCFDFHSDISALDADALLSKINYKIEEANTFLKQSNVLFITFGTSWVYKNNEKKIVANCHKIPKKKFTKVLLDDDTIIAAFKKTYKQIKSINPNINIVLSISPVRHIRDGIVENNQSKAQLISATHKLVSEFNNVHYFPAFEYIIDDLRDYRFFKADLVHPNELAIQYVFEKFELTYFNEATLLKKKAIEKVLKSLNHKVLFKETDAYKLFKNKLIKQIEILQNDGFDFLNEVKNLNS